MKADVAAYENSGDTSLTYGEKGNGAPFDVRIGRCGTIGRAELLCSLRLARLEKIVASDGWIVANSPYLKARPA